MAQLRNIILGKAFVAVVAIGVVGCSSVPQREPQRVPLSQAQEQQNAQILLERQFLRELGTKVHSVVEANTFLLRRLYVCVTYARYHARPLPEFVMRARALEVEDNMRLSASVRSTNSWGSFDKDDLKQTCPQYFYQVQQMSQQTYPAIKKLLAMHGVLKKQTMQQLWGLMLKELQYAHFKKTGTKLSYSLKLTAVETPAGPTVGPRRWVYKKASAPAKLPKKWGVEGVDFSPPVKSSHINNVFHNIEGLEFSGLDIERYVFDSNAKEHGAMPGKVVPVGFGQNTRMLQPHQAVYAPKAFKNYCDVFNFSLHWGEGSRAQCHAYHKTLLKVSQHLGIAEHQDPDYAQAESASKARCTQGEAVDSVLLQKIQKAVDKSCALWSGLNFNYDVKAKKRVFSFDSKKSAQKLSKLTTKELEQLYLVGSVLKQFSNEWSFDEIKKHQNLTGLWVKDTLINMVGAVPFLVMLKTFALQDLADWQDVSDLRGLSDKTWQDMERVFAYKLKRGHALSAHTQQHINEAHLDLMQFVPLVTDMVQNPPQSFLAQGLSAEGVERLAAGLTKRYESLWHQGKTVAVLFIATIGFCAAPFSKALKAFKFVKAAAKVESLRALPGIGGAFFSCGWSFDVVANAGYFVWAAYDGAKVVDGFLSMGNKLVRYEDLDQVQKDVLFEMAFMPVGIAGTTKAARALRQKLQKQKQKAHKALQKLRAPN